jgi:hypothetical protein
MKTHPSHRAGAPASRSGQAMVEFIVGIVVLLALLAGLLGLTSLTKKHTDLMVEARREAGNHALWDIEPPRPVGANPEFIRDWDVAADGKHLTPDDTFERGTAADFATRVIERSASRADDWRVMDQIPENDLAQLRGNVEPSSFFGFAHGGAEEEIDLLSPEYSLIRRMFYRADTIHLKSEVWMTWTKGIYD